jgi:hypothetical protein
MLVAHRVALREGGTLDLDEVRHLLLPGDDVTDWNIIDELFTNGRQYLAPLLEALGEEKTREIVGAWVAADPAGKLGVAGWWQETLPPSLSHALAPDTDASRIQRLAFATGKPRDTRIWLLEVDSKCNESTANRIASAPLGVPESRWPRADGSPMEHLLTVDLASMPELRGRLGGTRALAFFVSSREENSAYKPGTGQSAVLALSDEDLAKGHAPAGPSFSVVPVDVPAAVFARKVPAALRDLRDAIYRAPGRAGGGPLWLQDPMRADAGFVLQFDQRLVPVNLGDTGIMYGFADDVFWQCH